MQVRVQPFLPDHLVFRLALDDKDSSNQVGYRDLSLNVEVGWLKHDSGCEFLPVEAWDTARNVKTHICEIQIHVDTIFELTGRGLRPTDANFRKTALANYHSYRDLMIS